MTTHCDPAEPGHPQPPGRETATAPDWRDPDLDADTRLRSLVGQMTLREKVAQLTSVWPGVAEVTGNVAPIQEVLGRPADWAPSVCWGVGHLTRVFGTAPVTVPRAWPGCAPCRRPCSPRPG